MSLLTYFKEITLGWKLSLFLLVFCVWPLSAYLIFHYEPKLFIDLDLSKLTLLASAIASPFMVINIGVSFLLTNPKDDNLKWGSTIDQLLSGTVALGISISLWVLSFGAMATMIDCSLLTLKLIMVTIEVFYVVAAVWSKVIEDKRYRNRNPEASGS